MCQLQQERRVAVAALVFAQQVLQELLRDFDKVRAVALMKRVKTADQLFPVRIRIKFSQYRETLGDETLDIAEEQPAVNFHAPVLDIGGRRILLRVADMSREFILLAHELRHVGLFIFGIHSLAKPPKKNK